MWMSPTMFLVRSALLYSVLLFSPSVFREAGLYSAFRHLSDFCLYVEERGRGEESTCICYCVASTSTNTHRPSSLFVLLLSSSFRYLVPPDVAPDRSRGEEDEKDGERKIISCRRLLVVNPTKGGSPHIACTSRVSPNKLTSLYSFTHISIFFHSIALFAHPSRAHYNPSPFLQGSNLSKQMIGAVIGIATFTGLVFVLLASLGMSGAMALVSAGINLIIM